MRTVKDNKAGTKKTKKAYKILSSLLIIVLSVLLSSFTTQFIPTIFIGKFQMEFFILIVLYFILLSFLFTKNRRIFTLFVGVLIVGMSLFSILGGGWSISRISSNAANSVIFLFKNATSSQVEIRPSPTAIYPHISLQQRIQQKVDYTDSTVRDFAVRHSLMYFDDYYPKYRQICRQFSLLNYIKKNYKYVSDPSDFDYFAPPQASMQLMAGDCDDYSILMASVLKAIGTNVRIIWAPRHVYPELYCGNKATFEKYVSAIYALFEQEIGTKQIYYRIDKNDDYWLNIDYTDAYPGSVYYSDEVLSIIYIK